MRFQLARRFSPALLVLCCGQASAGSVETIQVTATRAPEIAFQVPADVSVISANELALRDVHDLAGAVALTAGVEAPPGGDAGPSSAVPAFWGLHEFDAFLLLVDGVPFGGAFNPSITTLDLTDVERIEVMRGAAPVMYGATSFVGVIQVLHYPAGRSSQTAEIGGGSDGSVRGDAAMALPALGDYVHSISFAGEELGYATNREVVRDGHVLYRGSTPLGGGTLSLDLALDLVRDVPPSPIPLDGNALTTRTPINANYNPEDAALDETSIQIALDYTDTLDANTWETKLSFTHSEVTDIRGFLRPALTNDGSDNADSQNQRRAIDDLYFDSHLFGELVPELDFVTGVDLLLGSGRQRSINGAYFVPLDGTVVAPPTTSLHVDEINRISDQRAFAGQYLQLDWRPGRKLDLIAGVRLNETFESKASSHLDGFDPSADLAADESKRVFRVSGTIGANYRAWESDENALALYADFRTAFKPAAIDFGPDYTPDILDPETANSYEAGAKGAVGSLAFETELFLLDFANLVVTLQDGSFANAGKERLEGAEFETRYELNRDLELALNLSYHDARFTASPLGFTGKALTLAPSVLASGGLMYRPPQGVEASFIINYVGPRFLDEANTAKASGYATFAATFGYRLGRYELLASGENLADVRPPVTQSEFGSASYYLLPGRRISIVLRHDLG